MSEWPIFTTYGGSPRSVAVNPANVEVVVDAGQYGAMIGMTSGESTNVSDSFDRVRTELGSAS